MSTPTTITIRTDKEVKKEAQQIFADLGLDLSTAINVFLRQVIIYQGIPFPLRKAEDFNAETLAAIDETENHPERLSGPYNNFTEIMESLDDDPKD